MFEFSMTPSPHSNRGRLNERRISIEKKKRVPLMKICLIGDGGVGKTALRERYVGYSFKPQYLATIGADFATRTEFLGTNEVKMLIWDLAGQPRFSIVREGYYKGARGLLLVFDISRPDSFESAPRWLEEAWKHIDLGRSTPLVLVGNKIDLQSEDHLETRKGRELARHATMVSTKQGTALCKEIDHLTPEDAPPVKYVETSAKTDQNVDYMFQTLGRMVFQYSQKKRKT